MLKNENIICFAKEWTEDPTSNNHVMRLVARDNRVLWLNSLSMRTPNLGNKDDVAKIKRKLKSLGQRPIEVDQGLRVYTPLVLPFPHSPLAVFANRQILRGTLAALRKTLGMKRFQAWTFLPTVSDYVGSLGEELSVYYCIDEWSQFSYLDAPQITRQEVALMRKVDAVFTTSRSLFENKRKHNPNTFLASHGVDHAHFATALREDTPLASELTGLKKPIIGFFGLIQDWIDLDLFAYLASQRPDWTIVIVGKSAVDLSELRRYPNIVLIDRRPYAELPRYCKGFDVALCPFRINDLTAHVNPIKLREYVSAGLGVVSTDIPECRLSPELTRIGRTYQEFLAQVEAVLREDGQEARARRSDAMKAETWERKVAAIGERILEVRAGKQSHACTKAQ